MSDCLFCNIAAGELPCKKACETDDVLAFYDIHPQAPTHILIIPKAHLLSGAAEITAQNSAVAARCLEVAARLAKELGLGGGFRIVTNNGAGACQTVPHLHFHLLAGPALSPNMA